MNGGQKNEINHKKNYCTWTTPKIAKGKAVKRKGTLVFQKKGGGKLLQLTSTQKKRGGGATEGRRTRRKGNTCKLSG